MKTGIFGLLAESSRKAFAKQTIQSVLDSLTSNEDLKIFLGYVFGLYGNQEKFSKGLVSF